MEDYLATQTFILHLMVKFLACPSMCKQTVLNHQPFFPETEYLLF